MVWIPEEQFSAEEFTFFLKELRNFLVLWTQKEILTMVLCEPERKSRKLYKIFYNPASFDNSSSFSYAAWIFYFGFWHFSRK